MKRFGLSWRWILVSILALCAAAAAASAALPVVGGKKAVAVVNGEPVTMEEFRRTLAALHEGVGEKMPVGGKNYSDLLQRLINGKLILQEARNIGLDALPEVRDGVKAYEDQTMRQILLARHVKNIRPDAREVEKAYRESIRELRIRSYILEKEEDAKQAEEEIRSGSDFDNVMRRLVSEGKAKGVEEGGYVKGKDLMPAISEAVSKLKVGEMSPVLKVPGGGKGESAYTILALDDVRHAESPEAKGQAARDVLKAQRLAAIQKYAETLKTKYAKIHKETLDGLDYEAKEPGLEKLLADPRPVADIHGEKAILVEDLSRALQQKFYHGVEHATTTKKVNREMPEVLNEMVITRVLTKEARRKKIDKTPEFRERVKEFQDQILFGMFVEKAINPGIKPDDGAMRKFYDEHEKEFSAPAMIRGEDLAFAAKDDASDALEKLRRGADFKWVKDNASGQAEEKSRQRVFPQDGAYVPVNDLPGGGAEAVAGAAPGDFRIHAGPEGQFLVLHILEVVPARPYPFEAVKEQIRNRIFRDEQKKSVDEWAGKLRAASKIRIFATDREMEKIFVPAGGAAGKP